MVLDDRCRAEGPGISEREGRQSPGMALEEAWRFIACIQADPDLVLLLDSKAPEVPRRNPRDPLSPCVKNVEEGRQMCLVAVGLNMACLLGKS